MRIDDEQKSENDGKTSSLYIASNHPTLSFAATSIQLQPAHVYLKSF